MSISIERTVPTTFGEISVLDSGGTGPVAFFIHGNSACKEVFQKQFVSGDRPHNFRLIAIDLPGHGKSENAKDPKRTYSLPGYAEVAIEVLKQMSIQKASIIGWSLGGHIAIDILKNWPGTQGILITGTPPIPLTEEGFKQGFLPFPCLHLMSQEMFSPEEAKVFLTQGGIPIEEGDFLLQAILRTHGIARSYLISSMQEGIGGNQKEIIETTSKPVAIICGEDDAGINNNYIQKEIAYGNLWNKKIYFLKGGMALFLKILRNLMKFYFNFCRILITQKMLWLIGNNLNTF